MATQTYIDALKAQTRKPVFKIEWMDKNEIVTDEIVTDLIEGEMTANLENGVRRTCNLTLENSDGKFLPDPNGLIYIGKKFKFYSGLTFANGTQEFIPQGVFNLGNPIASSQFSNKYVQIEAYDNFALLNGSLGGTLEDDYIIDVGSTLTDVVSTIFTDAGITKTPMIYPNSYVLPIDLLKEAGSTYGELLIDLANMFSWVIFFDVDGIPRFQPPVDELTTGSSWNFLTTEASYLGVDHNYDLMKMYNNIIVIGENIYGNTVRGQAQDTGIFSPTSISRIGKLTSVIMDSNIPDDSAAQDRADYELKLAIQLYENGDLKCIPIDILREGDIVTIEDSSAGFNRDRYLIKQLNLPLSFNGTQNIKAWKVRDTSFI